jgi:hypothetical protein
VAEYGVVSAPDILTGTPAQNKSVFDRLVREKVAFSLNAMLDEWDAGKADYEMRFNQTGQSIEAAKASISAGIAQVNGRIDAAQAGFAEDLAQLETRVTAPPQPIEWAAATQTVPWLYLEYARRDGTVYLRGSTQNALTAGGAPVAFLPRAIVPKRAIILASAPGTDGNASYLQLDTTGAVMHTYGGLPWKPCFSVAYPAEA